MKACDLCKEREAAFFLYQRVLRRAEPTAESCFVCSACLPRFHQEAAMRAREELARAAAPLPRTAVNPHENISVDYGDDD